VNLAEAERDDAADAKIGHRPQHLFAARSGAEVLCSDEYPRLVLGRRVKNERAFLGQMMCRS
jgi:hypothetical protein